MTTPAQRRDQDAAFDRLKTQAAEYRRRRMFLHERRTLNELAELREFYNGGGRA